MLLLLAVAAAAVPRSAEPTVSPTGDLVPIRFTPRGMPLVQARIGNLPVWLAVDTGANNSLLTVRAANRLKLRPHGGNSVTVLVNGGLVEQRHFQVPSLWLGKTVERSFVVRAADLDLARLGQPLELEVEGLLGHDLLSRLSAVVDYRSRTLRLTPRWADDLAFLQGEWRAADLERDGWTITPGYRQKLRQVRLQFAGDQMRLDMRPIGSVVTQQNVVLHGSHSPRRWNGHEMSINGGPSYGLSAGDTGLYEVTTDRLRLLFPQAKYIPLDQLPTALTAAVPGSNLMLFTFERVPPALGGWPDLLLGLLTRSPRPARPVRLGGWEWAGAPDWSLTATHAARKQRVTVQVDGSFSVRPLRP